MGTLKTLHADQSGPIQGVENKKHQEGLDPSFLELFDSADSVNTGKCLSESVAEEDPKLNKYRRMVKMGIPKQGVHNKMREDGIDPSLLDPRNKFISNAESVNKKNKLQREC